MAKTVSVGTGYGVDTRDFAQFAKALTIAAPAVRKELTIRMRAVGELVAGEARSNVEAFSSSVPPSIKVRVSGATVSVVAGGTGIPMAELLELGNAKGRSTDKFRHPVFGNKKVWVDQKMHPYLGPAVREKFDEVELAAVEALDAAVAVVIKA